MSRKQVFKSVEQLSDLIRELSQELGPDHSRVKRLRADLSRRIAVKSAATFPVSMRTAKELNKDIDAKRDAQEARDRAIAAATLDARIDAGKMAAMLDAVLDGRIEAGEAGKVMAAVTAARAKQLKR
jgi:hypothetical protein